MTRAFSSRRAHSSSKLSHFADALPFSSNDRLVLSAIERDCSVTVKGISAETGFAVRKVERILARLKGLGVVVRDGAKKDGVWVVDSAVYAKRCGGLIGGLEKDEGKPIESESDVFPSSFSPDAAGESGGLTETEISVLQVLLENPQMSLSAISGKIDVPRHHVEKVMNGLKKKGLVVRVGSVQRGYWEVSEEAKTADAEAGAGAKRRHG